MFILSAIALVGWFLLDRWGSARDEFITARLEPEDIAAPNSRHVVMEMRFRLEDHRASLPTLAESLSSRGIDIGICAVGFWEQWPPVDPDDWYVSAYVNSSRSVPLDITIPGQWFELEWLYDSELATLDQSMSFSGLGLAQLGYRWMVPLVAEIDFTAGGATKYGRSGRATGELYGVGNSCKSIGIQPSSGSEEIRSLIWSMPEEDIESAPKVRSWWARNVLVQQGVGEVQLVDAPGQPTFAVRPSHKLSFSGKEELEVQFDQRAGELVVSGNAESVKISDRQILESDLSKDFADNPHKPLLLGALASVLVSAVIGLVRELFGTASSSMDAD